MDFKGMLAVAVACGAFAAGAVEVGNVTARQRWPWKQLIDVDYEITGAKEGDMFRIDLTATPVDGGGSLCATTFRSEPLGGTGANHVIWDFGADYPELGATNLQIAVTATPIRPSNDMYCVIDLSSGPASTKYPVRYTFTGPGHVQGASGEKCQTTEMWLKRVMNGTYPFHGTDSNKGAGWYKVRISKDLYCGIFECTQQQWYQVMGTWPGKFTNELYRASRPAENIYVTAIIGQHFWPDDKTISDDSFVGRMRARTGLSTFNLPTEGQWEYVCRAGKTQSSLGTPIADYARNIDNCTEPKTYNEDTTYGTAFVGSYKANNWGFYDVLGNVAEWVLDSSVGEDALKKLYAKEIEETGLVTDPIGPPNSAASSTWRHVTRGGNYDNSGGNTSPYARSEYYDPSPKFGMRFCFTCE